MQARTPCRKVQTLNTGLNNYLVAVLLPYGLMALWSLYDNTAIYQCLKALPDPKPKPKIPKSRSN